MLRTLAILTTLTLASACSQETPVAAAPDVDTLVRQYLFLELSMGEHDKGHVDAYFGPEEIKADALAQALSLDDILQQSSDLAAQLSGIDSSNNEELSNRIAGLIARLQALQTRIAINKGESISFDDESRGLFGVTAPDYDAAHFDAILKEIDALLPGPEPLIERVEKFDANFEIPKDKIDVVIRAAIDECRERTIEHMDLLDGESFDVEYVTDKPWSGYNWYQGNGHSLIQINTEFPMYVTRAVDLGCHEGYPGHHTYNALLEENLVNDRGWLEFSLYPLFSPQSLIAEGSGNYGQDLAFPGDERAEFEKAVLFPLAGLDVSDADRFYELAALKARLNYAGNEAARDYLNGDIDAEQAVAWLMQYALSTEEKSRQRIRFYDSYRSYVINYNFGKDMVREYIESGDADETERWARFEEMLSNPLLPKDM